MKLKSGIKHLSEQINRELETQVPDLRMVARRNLADLVGTMLVERTANTMDLAAALPRDTERIDMRYQFIWRTLSNRFINEGAIMQQIAKPILEKLAKNQKTVVLLMDQTTAGNGDEILMLALRIENRGLPLFWHVEKTQGNIGFKHQKEILDRVASILPPAAKVVLMGDRFYGTSALVDYCNQKKWGYRLRIKGNIRIQVLNENMPAQDLLKAQKSFVENVFFASTGVPTNIGIIHDKGHNEPWIIVMNDTPNYYKTLDYGMRWSIESMFSDFKSRGFGLEETQIRYSERLSKLVLIMTLALYFAVTTGIWDEANNPLPVEKKISRKQTSKLRFFSNVLLQARASTYSAHCSKIPTTAIFTHPA